MSEIVKITFISAAILVSCWGLLNHNIDLLLLQVPPLDIISCLSFLHGKPDVKRGAASFKNISTQLQQLNETL